VPIPLRSDRNLYYLVYTVSLIEKSGIETAIAGEMFLEMT